jgi:hypothetical protein
MPILPWFTRSIVVRSLLAWGFVRLIVALGKAAVEKQLELAPTHPLELVPVAALLVTVMVSAAGWVYLRRRNEDLYLMCLGYDRAAVLALLALPVLALELVVGIAVRA